MDDLTLDQANAIIANKDPRGESFWKNDKATVEAVQRAFEVAHPGDMDIGEVGTGGEKVLAESLQGKKTEESNPADDPAAAEAYQAEVYDPLKTEWGAGYAANIEAAQERASEVLSQPLTLERMQDLEAQMSPEEVRFIVRLFSKLR
jgi:hypothetical protein